MPLVVVLLIGLAGLFASLAAFGVSYGSLKAWQYTFGALLQWMHDNLRVRIDKGRFLRFTIDFGGIFGSANNYVVGKLQTAVARSERDMGLFLHGIAASWTWTLATIEAAYHDSLRWSRTMQEVYVPRLIGAFARPFWRSLHAAEIELGQARRAARPVAQAVHDLPLSIPKTIARVAPKVMAAAVPGLAALPWAIPEIRGLTRRWARINNRLRRLEWLTAFGGAVALVTAALVKMDLGFLRCRDFKRLGKRIGCGGFGLLADLLGASFLAFAVLDLCRFTGALEAMAEQARPWMMDFVDVDEWLIKQCHYDRPDPLTLPVPVLAKKPLGLALTGRGDPLGSNVKLAAATRALTPA